MTQTLDSLVPYRILFPLRRVHLDSKLYKVHVYQREYQEIMWNTLVYKECNIAWLLCVSIMTWGKSATINQALREQWQHYSYTSLMGQVIHTTITSPVMPAIILNTNFCRDGKMNTFKFVVTDAALLYNTYNSPKSMCAEFKTLAVTTIIY